jgi:hypothetical protein
VFGKDELIMFAVLTRWQILAERDVDRLARLVAVRVGAAEGKQSGNLGWYVVQTETDTLLSIDLYEDAETAEDAARRIVPTAAGVLPEAIVLLDQQVAPAAEIPLVTKPSLP